MRAVRQVFCIVLGIALYHGVAAWLDPHPTVLVNVAKAEEMYSPRDNRYYGYLERIARSLEKIANDGRCKP